MTQNQPTTDFGFQEVPLESKADRVREVFDSVADRYDLMNDLMSLGLHRLWKRFALARTGLRPGQTALDLAGGTGDLANGLCRQVGPKGHVVLSDINRNMLSLGRDRLLDRGRFAGISALQADAEVLPFRDSSFHCITIGFGLRNVTRKEIALSEMARAVRPGGRVLVLEFSRPLLKVLEPLYDGYSFRVLPALGKLVANDEASYRYLAESIRKHPDQETLKGMMLQAGFDDCSYFNLAGGIVALHLGFRY